MRATVPLLLIFGLAACGGGGSDSPQPQTGVEGLARAYNNAINTYTPGTYMPASAFKSQCATPRTGINPATNQSYPDNPGTIDRENFWLRSWTNETYLWYSEVPDLNPYAYSAVSYFPLLKTPAVTASGSPKDQFHFTYPTTEWIALSQSGTQAGYGVQWFIVAGSPPRRIVVAFIEPGSPAASAGIARGDEVLTVDGVDATSGSTQAAVNTLNAGLFPEVLDQSHTIGLRRLNGTQYTATLVSENITSTPVQNVTILNPSTDRVGYFVFNDHIATSEAQLVSAINLLKAQSPAITDLILDIRYNGGGYLDIASELAYMIAGPSRTAGQTFEKLTFNDKNPTTDPVTGQALTPVPFHTTTQGFSGTSGQVLPNLGLSRVFVITGSGTCSASESIINSLRGVGVNVIQIGTTTCGKPYGFYPTDNCGTTYFSIQFKGVNALNFGEYPDGFTPTNSVVGTIGEKLPGCAVNDDFAHQLGDQNEARIAAALGYRASSGTCPAEPTTGPIGFAKADTTSAVEEGYLARPPAREIRILRTP